MSDAELEIFFAFPDGVLDYDCASCDAHCCRYGQVIGGSTQREMSGLFQLYPNLGIAATSRRGADISLTQPRGGCLFLRDDKLCGVEVDHGRELKPSVCQLFPFNRLEHYGGALVVLPHGMCPLTLRPGGDVRGDHRVLRAQLRSLGLTRTPERRSAEGVERERTVLAEEREFLASCEERLGREPFIETLYAHASDPEDLAAFSQRAHRLMGLAPLTVTEKPWDDLDAQWHGVASTFRFWVRTASNGARLRALCLAYELSIRLFSLNPGAASIGGLVSWMHSMMPKLHLLVLEDRPETLRDLHETQGTESPPFREPEFVLTAGVAQNLMRGGMDVLSALEAAIPATWSPADRSAFLVELGKLLRPDSSATAIMVNPQSPRARETP